MSVFTNPASGAPQQAAAYTAAILGLLGTDDPREVLRETTDRLNQAVRGLTDEEMRRREAPGKWSVAHVLRHLVDTEIVWAWRMRLALAQERPPITGFDQDAWADRLGYGDSDPAESLEEFAVLRKGNLRLLDRASEDDLARVGVHQERGEESVGHMMKLYAGHDRLHLNQIARIRAAITPLQPTT